MKYDMEVEAEYLQRAIDGDEKALGRAFSWEDTPQGEYAWHLQYHEHTPLDIEALKDIQRQCVGEVGTLAELNVKAGDVVELVGHKDSMLMGQATVDESGDARMKDGRLFKSEYDEEFGRKFRIISRADTATQSPKTWGEMTDAEKGALLLAKHEGKDIEYLHNLDWIECSRVFSDYYAYRIKPEPQRETVVLYGADNGDGWAFPAAYDRFHRITFDTIGGKPDCDSVKMEVM